MDCIKKDIITEEDNKLKADSFLRLRTIKIVFSIKENRGGRGGVLCFSLCAGTGG